MFFKDMYNRALGLAHKTKRLRGVGIEERLSIVFSLPRYFEQGLRNEAGRKSGARF